VNSETRALLQYFRFLSKTINESLNSLDWVARDTYEFKHITYAFGMSFFNSCAFHAKSFDE